MLPPPNFPKVKYCWPLLYDFRFYFLHLSIPFFIYLLIYDFIVSVYSSVSFLSLPMQMSQDGDLLRHSSQSATHRMPHLGPHGHVLEQRSGATRCFGYILSIVVYDSKATTNLRILVLAGRLAAHQRKEATESTSDVHRSPGLRLSLCLS